MDAALVDAHIAVVAEGGAEIEVLGLLSGELAAVGDVRVPGQVGAAQAHPHQQEAHAHAGVVVLAVGDHGHGVQTGTVGGAEGDAHAVQDAGQLVDDGHDLAEGAGVDVQLVQQVQQALGVEQITQLAHGDALVEHLRQSLLADGRQSRVDGLEDQGALGGVAVGQVQVDAGGHVAGDAGVDGVQVKLVGGVGGDEAIGDGVAGEDVGGVDLHGHVGLVDGDGALGGAGLVLGAAVVGDQNSLVLTRAHLGEAAQLNILGEAGNAGDGVNLALNGHPLGQGVAADDVVQAGDLVQDVVHVQIHAGLGVGQLGLVLDGEVVDGQGLTGGESGVVPVNEGVKDGLLHDGGVHVVGEGHAALEGHHAGQTAVGGGHFHSDGVAAVGLGLRHGDADLPLTLAELHQAGDVGLVQGLEGVGDAGLVHVVLHDHLVGGDSGGSGVHHGLIDGLGGGGVVIALVIGELHAHLVGALVQSELDLLTVLDGDSGLNGGGGVGLVAGVEDADLLLTGGDGGIAQAAHNGLTLQGQPLGVQLSDALVVVLDGHVADVEDGGALHHGVEDGGAQGIVVHLQVGTHGQGHGVGSGIQGVIGSLTAFHDVDGGLSGGGGVAAVAVPGDADLLAVAQLHGGELTDVRLAALQRHPGVGAAGLTKHHVLGVILDTHIIGLQVRSGGLHHGVKDALTQSVVVDGAVLVIGHSSGLVSLQHDGTGSALGKGDGDLDGGGQVAVSAGVGDEKGIGALAHGIIAADDGVVTLQLTPLLLTNGVLVLALDGYIVDSKLRGGGGHHGIKDGGAQAVIVDSAVVVIGQGHGLVIRHRNGGSKTAGLGQGDFGSGTLNADSVSSIIVCKGRIGIIAAPAAVERATEDTSPAFLGLACPFLAGAVVLPIIVLGVQTLFVDDQRVKQGLLHSDIVSTSGNNGGAILELDICGKGGDSLLHGGGLVGPGPPGGGGGQGSALDQGQGGQHSSQSPAQGMGTFHNNPSSHISSYTTPKSGKFGHRLELYRVVICFATAEM
ncbi:Uncharacterised protein [uncultured Flavonifractor sp.]|nr:Uncharacterised protein [uncultured Flavonifractor sp.]